MGPGISAVKMREALEDGPLALKRSKVVLRFALKCANSDRFNSWFPVRSGATYPRREGVNYNRYIEDNYRTDRRKNSPLCHMKQRLNIPVVNVK